MPGAPHSQLSCICHVLLDSRACMSDSDFTQRFLFDEFDARGELVSLRDSYAHVLAKHP